MKVDFEVHVLDYAKYIYTWQLMENLKFFSQFNSCHIIESKSNHLIAFDLVSTIIYGFLVFTE